MRSCPNYYPLVSVTDSNSINPCFIAVLLYILSAVLLIVSSIQLSQIKFKIGSIKRQSAHYQFRCVTLPIYALALLFYLPFIENNFFFYGVLLNLFVNVIFIFPVLVIEVLYSIIPSGVILYSTLLEFIIFGVLSLQAFFQGELPCGNVYFPVALQYVLALLSFTLFVSELIYYKPSVELMNHYLINKWPVHVPNAISIFTYTYMNGLVERNFGNPNMGVKDLDDMPIELVSDTNYKLLESTWTQELHYGNKSLFKALIKAFGIIMVVSFFYISVSTAASYVQPQLFKILIEWIGDESKTFVLKFLVCIAMFVCAILQSLSFNTFIYLSTLNSLSLSTSLMRLMFNKSIRLAPESKNLKSSGDIISTISVDTNIIEDFFFMSFHELILMPLELIIALVSLYFLLGNSIWCGLVIMIVSAPITTKILDSLRFLQVRHLARRDTRTSLVNDILTSIKSIKLYSWEKPMLEKLDMARNQDELGDLAKMQYYYSLARLISICIPYLISGSCFYVYTLYNDTPLTAAVMFPAISLFDMIKVPVTELPQVYGNYLELFTAIRKVQDFLLCEEIEPKSLTNTGSIGVEIRNAKFLWSKSDSKVALDSINYSVSDGKLSCIVGRVGAGKTAFLKAILGELPLITSDLITPAVLNVNGSVAYCPQVPWIMNATLKQNVLFNHEYDEDYYNLVLECCDLTKDIATLEDKHDTLVGEKGISLSGGQKLRLSLARALYARADIYILDDILSAVDSHVSAKLIAKVFNKKNGLLSKKTTILATNNVKVLSSADEIVFLEENTILERGSFQEVIANDKKLADLIKNFGSTVDEAEIEQYAPLEEIKGPVSIMEPYSDDVALARLTNSEFKDKLEKVKFGSVGFSTYLAYAKACGTSSIILTLVVMISAAGIEFADSYWLKRWADVNLQFGENVSVKYYIGVFLAIAAFISALSALRELCFKAILPINAAKILHHNMAHSVMRLPMLFFESTPIGRILNRFTGDIDNVDRHLAFIISLLSADIISIIVIVVVISVNLPVFLIFFVSLGFVYRYYHVYYVSLSREIKRLFSAARSPVISVIGESVNGDETIRAFNQLSRFDYFVSLVLDNSNKTNYNNFSFARWISVRLQFVGAIVVLLVATLSVLTQESKSPLSPALIALILSYTLKITANLERAVRMSAQCESRLVSVERILEYSELPSEAPLVIEDHRTSLNWPDKGSIEFINYSTTYKEGLKPVLKDLSFKINPLEKVGIVGRTGAGKSTLALSVFRLIEPTQGSIIIDGVDISEIGLFDLRHNLNIIPQDAQALQGTIRSNLDPLSQFTDGQLLKVLELSHFDKFFKEENILEFAISETGSNLSVGQRQLLCLSRALLNPSKVLILDEATAAVDVETDKIIQETIRKEFNDRTVITIAHRLDTILDYDRVLLLDAGEVKEFDTVGLLLQDKEGLFYKMCEKGGYL